jgi:hypothetical protein
VAPLAAAVAAGATAEFLASHSEAFDEILFVGFSSDSTRLYAEAIAAHGR